MVTKLDEERGECVVKEPEVALGLMLWSLLPRIAPGLLTGGGGGSWQGARGLASKISRQTDADEVS
jgi:hypothetical protein